MNYEFITMIVGFITIIITIVTLNNQLRTELKGDIKDLSRKQEEDFKTLSQKQDDNFKILLSRIDAVNSRLDNLYHELFKRDAA